MLLRIDADIQNTPVLVNSQSSNNNLMGLGGTGKVAFANIVNGGLQSTNEFTLINFGQINDLPVLSAFN